MSGRPIPAGDPQWQSQMRVAIAEGSPRTRDVLRRVVRELGHEVVVDVADGTSAATAIAKAKTDLILVGLNLEGLDGIEAVERARRRTWLDSKVIVVAGACTRWAVYRVPKESVHGFVEASGEFAEELLEGIPEVLSGRTCFSRAYYRVRREMRKDSQSFDKVLSRRELEALRMAAQFRTDLEIKVRMKISGPTVRWHIQNAMGKLGVHSRVELIHWARIMGFPE